MQVLEDLMEETDNFVWEFAAANRGLDQGDTFEETKNDFPVYTEDVSNLAGEHYDEALGADYMNEMVPWTYTAGFISAMSFFWYPIYKIAGKPFLKDKLTGDSNDDVVEGTVDYDRRDFMKKGAKEGAKFGAVLYPAMATFGDAVVEEPGAELEYGTVGDFREVYAAEIIDNISEKRDGDILAVYGIGHSERIAEYLRDEDLREQKLSVYSIIGSDEELKPELWEHDEDIDSFRYQGTIEM